MIKCSRCKEDKDFFEYSKNKSRKGGIHNVCKECSKIVAKEWRKNNAFNGEVVRSKYCSTCKLIKSSNNFYNDKSRSDGLS